MRVVQLGPVPPPHGGVQANFSAIHERLQMRGDESLLVGITRSEKCENQPNVYRPRSIPELVKLLFNLRPDILHLHFGGDFTLRLAALLFVASFVPRAKKILTFHSGGFASSKEGQAANYFDWRAFAARRLDKIIAVNEEIVRLFEKYGVQREKITLIPPHVLRQPNPNVVIPETLEKFIQRHSPLLFTASWLEEHYDLPLQIRALEFVREKFPNAGLLIVGAGEKENELKKRIAETNYAEHVLLAGDVPHEIVLHLIKRADVLLRTTHFDGDAISVREALHLGTPVIATDNKMRPAGVKLFKIGDLRGLQNAIVEQLQIGKPQKIESNDGWENIDAVLQIYDQLLQTKAQTESNRQNLLANPKSKI